MTAATRSNGAGPRERWCELLAAAEPGALAPLAEACIDRGANVTVLSGPDVGVVALQVREPVVQERFYLGEVLVTQVEVDVDGTRGWAMRMGSDRTSALAAAILDAERAADGPLSAAIDQLCGATARALDEADRREWDEIAPTEVHFEELD